MERGETERLRLARRTYQGRPYIDLRVEWRAPDGSWRPSRKGLSLRARELAELAGALDRAADRVVADARGDR